MNMLSEIKSFIPPLFYKNMCYIESNRSKNIIKIIVGKPNTFQEERWHTTKFIYYKIVYNFKLKEIRECVIGYKASTAYFTCFHGFNKQENQPRTFYWKRKYLK